MQLNRQAIVSAGVSILDSYGLADLTIRRIAAHLGVAPGALYWHVKNKQSLIEAIAEVFLAPVLELSSTPSKGAANLAFSLRQAVLAHRDGADVVTVGLAMPGLRAAVLEQFHAALVSAGLSDADATFGAATVVHFIMGSVSAEQTQAQLGEDPAPSDFRELFVHGLTTIFRGLGLEGEAASIR